MGLGMRSTLYAPCPGCKEKTLIQEMQGKLTCAACSFDYASLAEDPERLEAHLVTLLKEGPLSQLAALELHRRLTRMPNVESIAKVRELATKNGVTLPDPADAGKAFRSIMMGVGGIVIAIVALIVYAVTR
jgi:hypothetical protein